MTNKCELKDEPSDEQHSEPKPNFPQLKSGHEQRLCLPISLKQTCSGNQRTDQAYLKEYGLWAWNIEVTPICELFGSGAGLITGWRRPLLVSKGNTMRRQ
jgi:hypothetical protein